jgi:hypothetical protein
MVVTQNEVKATLLRKEVLHATFLNITFIFLYIIFPHSLRWAAEYAA